MENNYYNEMMGIAIIGLSCDVPGAKNQHTFWENICAGKDCIVSLSDDELIASGISPKEFNRPDYVRRSSYITDVEYFDPEFFNMTAREASLTDPAQRYVLLGCANALQDAGYTVKGYNGEIGVYAGTTSNAYYEQLQNLNKAEYQASLAKRMQLFLSNDKDYCASRVSHKLNLTGPSVSVSTACSTGLVAIHMACKALLNYECDMAFASGAKANYPNKEGYKHEEGGVLSKEGQCRAFDEDAAGTIFGSGSGTVLLKRLEDAIEDRDNIYAIIRGSSVSNDGGEKSAFSAPSVRGQTKAIGEAIAAADINPDTISYVEAHGTGTSIGDPIEIESLTRVYRAYTDKKQYCAIGSVKTNIGHIEAGAGVIGVIKVAKALRQQQIPPSLHYNRPNPKIDFPNSPFFVNTELRHWEHDSSRPRRAGVSSFGMGGSNAHAVMEEAPKLERAKIVENKYNILVLSAKNESSLVEMEKNLSEHLKVNSDLSPSDIAYTLQNGRDAYTYRTILTYSDVPEIIKKLDSSNRFTGTARLSNLKSPVFMFPGQGSQHLGMLGDLYANEEIFRNVFDHCSEILTPLIDCNLKELLYSNNSSEAFAQQIQQTCITQPALFATEYSLAKLLIAKGIHPSAMIGHSIGEYVAACLAGVFQLEDCLNIIATRGKLMQSMPAGDMLAVSCSKEEITTLLENLDLAAVNSADWCVVSGEASVVHNFENKLTEMNVDFRPLRTSHAFHSSMMNPILDEFKQKIQKFSLSTPQLPFVSNVSGTWITDEQAVDPDYWCQQLRGTVNFYEGTNTLVNSGHTVFLEVGPNNALSKLVELNKVSDENYEDIVSIPSCRTAKSQDDDQRVLAEALGKLWLCGTAIDWKVLHNAERYRVSLPCYAYQRQWCWIEDTKNPESDVSAKTEIVSKDQLGNRVDLPLSDEIRYQMVYNSESPDYLPDHQISDVIIMPGAGYISIVLSALKDVFGDDACIIRDIYFVRALIIDSSKEEKLQLILQPTANDQYTFKLVSLSDDGFDSSNNTWVIHCEGSVTKHASDNNNGTPELENIRTQWSKGVDKETLYSDFVDIGYNYGQSFQWIEEGWINDDEKICRFATPNSIYDIDNYQLHPGVIDSCFQVLSFGTEVNKQNKDKVAVPFHIQSFEFFRSPKADEDLWCHVSLKQTIGNQGETENNYTMTLFGENGGIVAVIDGLKSRYVNLKALKNASSKERQDSTYRINWLENNLDIESTIGTPHKQRLIVFADDKGIGDQLIKLSIDVGCNVVKVKPGERYQIIDQNVVSINAENEDDFSRLFETAFPGQTPDKILYLWGLDHTDDLSFLNAMNCHKQMATASLNIVKTIVKRNFSKNSTPQLIYVAQGAQAVGTPNEIIHPLQSGIWGLNATIAQEHPELNCVYIDLQTESKEKDALSLFNELIKRTNSNSDTQIAYRQGRRFVARMQPYRIPPTDSSLTISADKCYIITGGLGALGLEVAKRLVSIGAKHLILVGRRGPGEATQKTLDTLASEGANIICEKADIADFSSAEKLFDNIAKRGLSIGGIIHSAGVLDDGIFVQQSWERFEKVLNPKLALVNLHRLSLNIDLEFFVCFSSIASVVGPLGQANYATANSFMDGLIHYRRSQGLPGNSINWGAWAEVGMAANLSDQEKSRAESAGMTPLPVEEGLNVLENILTVSAFPQITTAIIDWGKLFSVNTAWTELPFYSDLYQLHNSEMQSSPSLRAAKDSRFLAKLQATPIGHCEALILTYVQSVIAGILKTQEVEPNQPLVYMGLDSLTTLELRNQLQIRLDLAELPVAFMLQEDTTVTTLTSYIFGFIASDISDEPLVESLLASDDSQEEASEELTL